MNDLERSRIVIDTLGARIGQLMVENVEMLARIHDLEQRLQQQQPAEEPEP